MALSKIASLGFESADENIEHLSFNSQSSLLDYDIVLIRPEREAFTAFGRYQGKPCLDDNASFRLSENINHWHREIREAVENGKTVIIFLGRKVDAFIATGENEYSGTGRNQKITRIVKNIDNYAIIPVSHKFQSSSGTSMLLQKSAFPYLSDYWARFEIRSAYKVFIEGKITAPAITTKSGARNVGAIFNPKSSSGALILLPDLDFDNEDFWEEDGNDFAWTRAGIEFFLGLTDATVAIDRAIKSGGEKTPVPEWANDPSFRLNEEISIQNSIVECSRELDELMAKKDQLTYSLAEASVLKGLLFEAGKPLERSIICALNILGYEAEGFADGYSEFDVVFSAEEGRLIGEAEGKDNKPINITKLRQLSMNIHEDLERDEVTNPAKGVLFGNAFRLTRLEDRADPFTEKCVISSKSNSISLVSTPDLFRVAKYISESADMEFAKHCREQILSTVGRVHFPDLPTANREGAASVPITVATKVKAD